MRQSWYQIPNTKSIQIAKFIGGENSGIELEPDKRGTFVTSLDVGTVMKDSADKYECSPGPGKTAVARVHVITEGECSCQSSRRITPIYSHVIVLVHI